MTLDDLKVREQPDGSIILKAYGSREEFEALLSSYRVEGDVYRGHSSWRVQISPMTWARMAHKEAETPLTRWETLDYED